MTNEEAIAIIGGFADNPLVNDSAKAAFRIAVEALEESTMRGDLISRTALIERFNNAEDNFREGIMEKLDNDEEDPFSDGVLSTVFNLRVMVQQAPGVDTPREKSRWIPVNELLPEEFQSVLVCYKSQGGYAQCVSERIIKRDGEEIWSAMYGQKPIAWMPLPKYEGGI